MQNNKNLKMYGNTNFALILSRLAFKYKLYSTIYLYVSISHCSVMFITYVMEIGQVLLDKFNDFNI